MEKTPLQKYIDSLAERLSESIDYQTQELLRAGGFLSINEARRKGWDIVIEQKLGEIRINLVQVKRVSIIKVSLEAQIANEKSKS